MVEASSAPPCSVHRRQMSLANDHTLGTGDGQPIQVYHMPSVADLHIAASPVVADRASSGGREGR